MTYYCQLVPTPTIKEKFYFCPMQIGAEEVVAAVGSMVVAYQLIRLQKCCCRCSHTHVYAFYVLWLQLEAWLRLTTLFGY